MALGVTSLVGSYCRNSFNPTRHRSSCLCQPSASSIWEDCAQWKIIEAIVIQIWRLSQAISNILETKIPTVCWRLQSSISRVIMKGILQCNANMQQNEDQPAASRRPFASTSWAPVEVMRWGWNRTSEILSLLYRAVLCSFCCLFVILIDGVTNEFEQVAFAICEDADTGCSKESLRVL